MLLAEIELRSLTELVSECPDIRNPKFNLIVGTGLEGETAVKCDRTAGLSR
jgi:hypothetical protein